MMSTTLRTMFGAQFGKLFRSHNNDVSTIMNNVWGMMASDWGAMDNAKGTMNSFEA